MLWGGVEGSDIRIEGDQGSPRGKILEQLRIAGGTRFKGEGDRAEARDMGRDHLWLDQAVGRAFDIEVIEAEPSSWMVVTASVVGSSPRCRCVVVTPSASRRATSSCPKPSVEMRDWNSTSAPQSRRRDGHVKGPAAQRRGVVVQAAREATGTRSTKPSPHT